MKHLEPWQIELLNDFCNEQPVVRGLFTRWAGQSNNHHVIYTESIENIFGRSGVKRKKITALLKDLEALEFGKFTKGRRGAKSRFKPIFFTTVVGRQVSNLL